MFLFFEEATFLQLQKKMVSFWNDNGRKKTVTSISSGVNPITGAYWCIVFCFQD